MLHFLHQAVLLKVAKWEHSVSGLMAIRFATGWQLYVPGNLLFVSMIKLVNLFVTFQIESINYMVESRSAINLGGRRSLELLPRTSRSVQVLESTPLSACKHACSRATVFS